jgi:hypothetical protein
VFGFAVLFVVVAGLFVFWLEFILFAWFVDALLFVACLVLVSGLTTS